MKFPQCGRQVMRLHFFVVANGLLWYQTLKSGGEGTPLSRDKRGLFSACYGAEPSLCTQKPFILLFWCILGHFCLSPPLKSGQQCSSMAFPQPTPNSTRHSETEGEKKFLFFLGIPRVQTRAGWSQILVAQSLLFGHWNLLLLVKTWGWLTAYQGSGTKIKKNPLAAV